MYEDDIDYATRRLNNTLVRLQDGSPFYISRTFYDDARTMIHHGTNLATSVPHSAMHSELNLEPVPLGFVNTSSDMVYVARKPMRRDWKQGLSHNSMITYGRLRPDEVNMKLLVQPIMQQYPTFARALQSLKGKKNSIAFSREFGLTKQGDSLILCYRQHPVGVVSDNGPVLYAHKSFLQQHLDEAMGA
jgi:hypothetical protein